MIISVKFETYFVHKTITRSIFEYTDANSALKTIACKKNLKTIRGLIHDKF